MNNYVLDDSGTPVPEPDLLKWARWFETSWPARQVARTELGEGGAVSTIFLGVDHNFFFGGPPVLYETMIFGGTWDGHQWRWHTGIQALAGHDQIVAALRAGRNPEQDQTESVP